VQDLFLESNQSNRRKRFLKKAIKYIFNASPIYVYLKKHFCPVCKTKLQIKYTSEIVNSNSSKAKEYDFSVGDTFMVGDVEFRTKCFYCSECNRFISFQDMKKFEKKK
jgi:uncharacterized protein YbaR (Trm112 family)